MQDLDQMRRKYEMARTKRDRNRKIAFWTIVALAVACAIYVAFFTFNDRARRNAIECAEAHGLVPQDAYPSNTGIVWMRLQQGDEASFVSVKYGACAPQHALNPSAYMAAREAYMAEQEAFALSVSGGR